jgi:hypothetical protein
VVFQHCAPIVCAWFVAEEFDFSFFEGEMPQIYVEDVSCVEK